MTTDDVLKNRAVLVVDDEPDNLEIACQILKTKGATVYEAKDGAEALAVLSRVKIDLVLSDIFMPNMDGFELLAKIRENPDYITVPVIAITANAMQLNEQRVSLSGFDGFLAKPFTIALFLTQLERVLKQRARKQ